MIYGIEALIEYFEDLEIDEKGSDKGDNSHHDTPNKGETKRMKTYPAGIIIWIHWSLLFISFSFFFI